MGKQYHFLADKRPIASRFAVIASATILSLNAAHADPNTVASSGLPTQIKPTYQEPGVPAFSFPAGGIATLGASFDPSTYTDPNVGNGLSAGAGGGGADNGGSALNTMNAQSWGQQAKSAAYAMGVTKLYQGRSQLPWFSRTCLAARRRHRDTQASARSV
ncbi:hypothetical protein [uncultured Rhodoblastus sp.]|uniref:hypothetical protein n=1 Tax=uncultured Rhodoblastus sp. TaxID=543037 RepID=UPI0025E1FCBD|nr:hypothetical protein [uncultured Rhodoblastus sp.]